MLNKDCFTTNQLESDCYDMAKSAVEYMKNNGYVWSGSEWLDQHQKQLNDCSNDIYFQDFESLDPELEQSKIDNVINLVKSGAYAEFLQYDQLD